MTSIFVTGSSDGLGRHTAERLIDDGHRVVVHARNDGRAEDTRAALPGAAEVLVGDLSSLEQTRALAGAATAAGPFEVVIHNAGVGSPRERTETLDGLETVFQVNVLAPYVLTASMPRPERLVYLTSGLEAQGRVHLDDLQWTTRRWNGSQAYNDSKLLDVLLAFGVARRWPHVYVNAVDPGWIKTRMGGASAPGDLDTGTDTQVWLATSDDAEALVTSRYFKSRRPLRANEQAYDADLQDQLLLRLARLSEAVIEE